MIIIYKKKTNKHHYDMYIFDDITIAEVKKKEPIIRKTIL